MPSTLGVCSWSLQPTSPSVLVERVHATGCRAVQLHLDPLRAGWDEAETVEALGAGDVRVLSGMMTMEGEDYSTLESIRVTGGVRPDSTWAANLESARRNAAIAETLGLSLVTFHAGWIPHDARDPERATMIARVAELERIFAAHGVRVGLETGQETADTLLGVLEEIPDVGVNFDPANMILYGMGDPHEALEKLGPRVVQLHVKDARPTATPGTWGEEVVPGDGAVDWPRFLDIAARVCPRADLLIEREAGSTRVEDVRRARELVWPMIGGAA
jgi:L-ribulose-5-phosphate 3-epimerase